MVKLDEPFTFGDRVKYNVNNVSGEAIVIGFPSYSDKKDTLILSNDAFDGMPLHMKWCKRLRRPNIEKAKKLRERYEALYPTFLQDL